jgi:hypothetical protein
VKSNKYVTVGGIISEMLLGAAGRHSLAWLRSGSIAKLFGQYYLHECRVCSEGILCCIGMTVVSARSNFFTADTTYRAGQITIL